MTVTLHLGLWMVPSVLTLFGIAAVVLVGRADMKTPGWGSGLMTMFTVFIVVPAVLISWVVWGLTFLLR